MTLAVLLGMMTALAAACALMWRSSNRPTVPGAVPGRPDSDVLALWRRREQARRRGVEQARQRTLPSLPAADTPPAGLAPLVPSRRAVGIEAARGIRALESWLADQTTA